MFSISLPVYSKSEFIPTTLESIKEQSCPYELAVLDATSDNSVQKVLEGYNEIIKYGYHHEDDGQAAAIQEGWNNTSGEIVAWLNADDYYFPNTLELVKEVFNSDPAIDVVYGHGVHVSPEGNFQMYFPVISEDLSLLTRGCTILQPSCFVRREAMEKVGGLDLSLHYTMDWDFWVRLFKAGCVFRFLNKPLSVVRVYPETKTLQRAKKRYIEINDILKKNTGIFNRIKALLSFYNYDLAYRRNGLLDHLFYHILQTLSAVKNTVVKRPVIKGLECWTNYVKESCEVPLPWYLNTPPSKVTVIADRNADLSMTLAGKSIELASIGTCETDFKGEKMKGYIYSANIKCFIGNLALFELISRNGPFRLLFISLNIQ